MSPFNARFVIKLYTLSNFGLQEKYISKFSGARSIQQATITAWDNEKEVLESVQSVEATTSDHLKNRQPSDTLKTTIYRQGTFNTLLAQILHDSMWGLPIEGITMPAQQEQTGLYRWEEIPLAWAPHAVLIIVNSAPHITRGAHTPNYGSATNMRVRRAPISVLEIGNIVSSLKQLMKLRGWVKWDEINRQTYHGEDICVDTETQLMYKRQVYSSAISHRFPYQGLKLGGMSNQNLNFSSHIRIISDISLHYTKSGTNYMTCF